MYDVILERSLNIGVCLSLCLYFFTFCEKGFILSINAWNYLFSRLKNNVRMFCNFFMWFDNCFSIIGKLKSKFYSGIPESTTESVYGWVSVLGLEKICFMLPPQGGYVW